MTQEITNNIKNKIQIALTPVQKLEAQKEKLLNDSKRIEKNMRELEAKIAKSDAARLREYDFRKKVHAGGMMAMVGMFEYVYGDKIRDNEQDDLIANLLVGSLLKASESLNKASSEELMLLWEKGKAFRAMHKHDRSVPDKNSKLDGFIKYVEQKLKATKQQSDGNVQSDKAVV